MTTLVERLEAMLASGHDGAQLRFGLANAYASAEDYESATQHATVAVALDPDYSAAWRLLGRMQALMGKKAEARQSYVRGIDVATRRGDLQLVKEMKVFLARLDRSDAQSGAS
jgi:Tfp pilus assembly protein PilF